MSTGPAQAFPVGEHLLEELETRGWTQAEFAEILGRPPQVISEIISGKKEVTRESAAQIGAALDMSAAHWLKLQDIYYLWKQQQDAGTRRNLEEVRLRARLKYLAPIAVLRKRGIVTATTTQGQVEQVCRLFNLDSIFDEPEISVAARRSNQDERLSPTQAAWVACVKKKAEDLQVPAYSSERFRVLCENLSRKLESPAAFSNLPESFAECGVALVYFEAFPASKIDGASFLSERTPVIGLSGRGHRLDKVLFSLLHESSHVLLNHVEEGLILDDEDRDAFQREQDADELAAHWALPGKFPDIPDRIDHSWITDVANAFGVHPIVIIGRLQKQNILTWRTSLAKDAPKATNFLREW